MWGVPLATTQTAGALIAGLVTEPLRWATGRPPAHYKPWPGSYSKELQKANRISDVENT